jgi:uncharacterized damage-inducible protein DinB
VTDIQGLYDYNDWANERILAAADRLTAAQFAAPTRFPGESLRGCLLHVVNALRFHLAGWQGERHRDLTTDDVPDVATLRRLWAREDAALRAFLDTLADADLDRPATLSFAWEGLQTTAPLWKLIVHNINHATQHRADAAQMLTDLGHSPGNLDVVGTLSIVPIEA